MLASQHENWGESNMPDRSPRTDTSTDVDPEDKNQRVIYFKKSYIRVLISTTFSLSQSSSAVASVLKGNSTSYSTLYL